MTRNEKDEMVCDTYNKLKSGEIDKDKAIKILGTGYTNCIELWCRNLKI